jgi:hypothetical protein
MSLRRSAAIGLFAATFLAVLATAQTGAPDWIDRDKLVGGEALFQTLSEGRGTVTIELAIRIEAGWQTIWKILTACELSPEYVPHVQACIRIEPPPADGFAGTGGDSAMFQQTVKAAFFLPRFNHVFRLDYFPPERIEVSHVSGPMDRMEGHWKLIPDPDGSTLLLQKMTVKPAFPVPRFFVRNTLERDMPPVLLEVRRRAEAAN